MSRTWKKYSGNCYRNPRGKRQALIAGVRNGALPPDSWDDVSLDKHTQIPFRVAEGLRRRGESYPYIVDHIMKKFGIRRNDAEWVAEWGGGHVDYDRRNIPEGILWVYQEKLLK
jgi:hypothetical protein